MADKADDNTEEVDKENIFRTLQDDKNRDTLLGILEPVIESVLTTKFSDIETRIKSDVSSELKSLVESSIKDMGVSSKKATAKVIGVSETIGVGHQEPSEKKELKRVFSCTEDAIAHWRKMANDEWENARRTDLTELKGFLTVICLDTSASMSENNAFEHSKQFVLNYLDAVGDAHPKDNVRCELVALVTFGMETKVKMRFSRDYERIKSEIDQLKPEGPSTMFGGLVLAKAVARASDYVAMLNEDIELLPKIILITDGKPTDISLIDGPERSDEDIVEQTKQIIKEEVKILTEKKIELHIVYVGKPDYDFLHSLRDCSGGVLMPYTDGEKMAHHTFFCAFLLDKQKNEDAESPEPSEFLKQLRQAQGTLLKQLQELPAIPDVIEILEKMKKDIKNPYSVVDDKKSKYPRIGSRVRRGKDWKWGDQDGKGPGTIIGHFRKENSEDRQIHVWVEWDEDDRQNVYRFKTNRRTKSDVKFVDEERIPPDDEILAVGMKVGTGPDFPGDQKLKQGVVIRIIDYDDENDNGDDDDDGGIGISSDDHKTEDISKAEILWEDNERGVYYFGENESKIEIQPRTQFTTPMKPQKIDITEVTDREVFIQWDRPASCGGCGIIKYRVFKKDIKSDSEWCAVVEVESNETKATIADLEVNEMYLFAVVAVNKIGPGDLAETTEAVKLKLSICKPEPPSGPLNIRNVTKSSCTIFWKESQVCEEKPVTHYIVEFRESNKSSWERVDAENKTSHKLTQLRRSTTYELRVKSVNKTGVSEPLGINMFVTKNFLDSDIPRVKLQDKHLVELSAALAGDWQLLGHYLGLNNVAIDCVVSDNKSSGITMWIFKMLSIWKQKNPETADFYRLIEGIEAVSTLKVDWDKIAEIASRINPNA